MNYEDHCIGLGKLWGDLQGPANAGAKTNRKNISLRQKAMAQIALVGRAAQGLGMGDIAKVYKAQRFDLRFFRPFRADLSIKKSSSFFPPLIAATSQRGLAPRPAQVSPEGPRYFGGTFFPRNALPPPRPPTTAIAL